MVKPEVGKAVWINKENYFTLTPFGIFEDVKAYCKGKNGHYFMLESRFGGMNVIRLQRMNQLNPEELYLASAICDQLYDINEPTDEALALFEKIVADHQPYRKKTKNKDMQRKRCYQWEAFFGNDLIRDDKNPNRFISFAEAVALSKRICDDYGIKHPKFKKGSAGTSWARGHYEVKYLIPQVSNRTCTKTVIHEIAHVINSAKNDRTKEAGHGPKFIGIYIILLERYMQINRKYLEETAKNHKLKIEYTI